MDELAQLLKDSDYILPVVIIFLLAFWATFALLGFSLFKLVTSISNFIFDQYVLVTYTLSPQEKAALEYKMPFYRNLNTSNKRKFACNVKYFISKKVFEGRDGCRVTEEMKLLIAGAATQIAFGHFPTIYEHFRCIVIYPDKYFSGSTQRYHLGEVQSNGVIKLSWKAFTEGAAIQNDGVHVGYHEMAHALKIEDATLHDMEHCFMDKTALQNFHRYANERIRNFKEGSYMRDYAFSNSEEFFAVSIEYFFETPAQLKKQEPEVYNYLRAILNLDPLMHQNPVVSYRY